MLSKLSNVSRCLQKKAVSQIKITPKNLNSSIRLSSSFLPSPSSGQINFDKKYFSTSSFKCDHAEEKNLENHAQENDNIDIEGLHPISKLALGKMGIDKLFEVQAVTFKKTRQGHDLIVQAPTGSGKTLSFVLPVMEKLISQAEKGRYRLESQRGQARPACLVIAPTRELANQTAAVFNDYIRHTRRELPAAMREITTCCVYGGAPMAGQYQTLVSGDADIIIGTPGRLKAFQEEQTINLNHLEILILDESDRMLDMGFKEDIEKIMMQSASFNDKRKSFGRGRKGRHQEDPIEEDLDRQVDRQVLLYSATCPPWVKKAARDFLSDDMEHLKLVDTSQEIGGRNINVHHYAIRVNSCRAMKEVSMIINYLVNQITLEKTKVSGTDNVITRSLIFSRTKRQCDHLGNLIQNSEVLHGDVAQTHRERIYNDFKRGSITTVVATDLASRGIDIPDIDLIVQLEPPQISEIETYVHRSGRAGRAGKTGISIVLYDSNGDSTISAIERKTGIQFAEFLLPEREELLKSSYEKTGAGEYGEDDLDFGQYGGTQHRRNNYRSNDRYGGNRDGGDRYNQDRFNNQDRYGGGGRSSYSNDRYDNNRNDRYNNRQRYSEENDRYSNRNDRSDRYGGRSEGYRGNSRSSRFNEYDDEF